MNYITIILIAILLIFAFRLIGSWMLRINDIIKKQDEIIKELKRINR